MSKIITYRQSLSGNKRVIVVWTVLSCVEHVKNATLYIAMNCAGTVNSVNGGILINGHVPHIIFDLRCNRTSKRLMLTMQYFIAGGIMAIGRRNIDAICGIFTLWLLSSVTMWLSSCVSV